MFRHAPHGRSSGREGLDAVLAASAFEVPTTVLFEGDGVYLLLKGQDAAGIDAKDVGPAFEALPMFDVEDLQVHAPSLAARGLGADDLLLPVQLVDDAGVRDLVAAADQVLSY